MNSATTTGPAATAPDETTSEGTKPKDGTRTRPRRLGLNAEYVERGKQALAALEASAPDAGAGEKIIHELVASQFALALAIRDAEIEVTARLAHFVNDPKRLVLISRALRDLVTLSGAIGRRIEGALTTASTLRAQRRLWKMAQS